MPTFQQFELETILPDNRDEYVDKIVDFYRLRHTVFVEELNWDLPMAADGFEIDQFDRPDTIYMLITNADSQVISGMRLLPTVKPHLLSEVFPHLAKEPIPTGPKILESSRSCVHPSLRGTSVARPIYGMLVLGVMGHCLKHNIEFVTFVSDEGFAAKVASHMDTRLLGEPTPYKSQRLVAGEIQINRRAYETMRSALGLPPEISDVAA